MKIKAFKVNLKGKKEIKSKFNDIINSGMLSMGDNVHEVENKISKMFNYEHAIGVSSGSAALLIIYKYIKKYYNVLRIGIPTNTFYATYRMAELAGLIPIILPCKGLHLDLDAIKYIVNRKRLDAVTAVHVGGFIDPSFKEFSKWCKLNKVQLIEDCAHSIGSKLRKTYSGNFGFAGAISFFATKTLTGGEGGIIVTNSNKFSKWANNYRNYGKSNPWISYHQMKGENLRMNEFSAAVISVQLDYFEDIMKERGEIANIYLDNIPEKYRIIVNGNTNS